MHDKKMKELMGIYKNLEELTIDPHKYIEAKKKQQSGPIRAYHGTPKPIEKFVDDFVGQGIDQEGPGIYFTSNLEDAYGYARKSSSATGTVYEVELDLKNAVPEKGRVPLENIKSLVEWADNWQDKLMDWGYEDLNMNFKAFNDSLKREKTPKDVYLSIWYNLYRYAPIDYVRGMVSLNLDGLIIKKDFMNTYHYVVYNPKIIKVIDQL